MRLATYLFFIKLVEWLDFLITNNYSRG